MSTLVASGSPASNFAALSTAELRDRLAASIQVTADKLAEMAAIWSELEARGEDLSDLRRGIGHYIPMIAAGRLAAEAVVAFSGSKTVLRSMANLPLAEQRRLARDGRIAVASDDGSPPREIQVSHLPARMAAIVFGDGYIRDPREQAEILAVRPRAREAKRPGVSVYVTPDRQNLVAGNTKIPMTSVIAALASIADTPSPSQDGARHVPIALTESEHRALKTAASRSGTTMSSLVRGGLAALGLLSDD